MCANTELRNERNVRFVEGLKEQEGYGTTKRYDAESMSGLKKEEVKKSHRFWYKNSFMNCSDPQIVLG